MEKLTRETITELIEAEPVAPAITIYAPMHKSAAPPHMTEDQIRLKNLIHKACEQLGEHGKEHELARQLQAQLEDWQGDQTFWETQSEALLICARPGSIRIFNLPVDTEEYVAIDDTFHLAPVLGLVQDAQEFYVLSITRHQPALYKGDMYGLYATNVALPETLEAALNIDEINQKSEHASSARGSSLNTSGYHGRGGAKDPGEEDQAKFFRLIDKIVYERTDRSLPLILAGIDAETAEYRQHSKYPKIAQQTISGSFANAKPQDLYDRAREIIQQEVIDVHHQEAIEEYQMLKGANPDRVANNKEAITEAAEQGRIDKLLVQAIRYTTDTIRDTRQAVARITFPEFDLSSAMNKLAARVWQTSGRIISLEAGQMPDGLLMAARMRY